jgi:uncharacterized cupredoxin-like copper-binding protein
MRPVAASGIAAAVLAVTACGGDSKGEQAATGPSLQTYAVSETDFKLSPSTFTIDKAGTYTFHAVNDGQVTHSLEIEGNGVETKLASDLQPGASGDLEAALPAGTYEIYCPVGNHKDMGMEGKVEVAAGSSRGYGG